MKAMNNHNDQPEPPPPPSKSLNLATSNPSFPPSFTDPLHVFSSTSSSSSSTSNPSTFFDSLATSTSFCPVPNPTPIQPLSYDHQPSFSSYPSEFPLNPTESAFQNTSQSSPLTINPSSTSTFISELPPLLPSSSPNMASSSSTSPVLPTNSIPSTSDIPFFHPPSFPSEPITSLTPNPIEPVAFFEAFQLETKATTITTTTTNTTTTTTSSSLSSFQIESTTLSKETVNTSFTPSTVFSSPPHLASSFTSETIHEPLSLPTISTHPSVASSSSSSSTSAFMIPDPPPPPQVEVPFLKETTHATSSLQSSSESAFMDSSTNKVQIDPSHSLSPSTDAKPFKSSSAPTSTFSSPTYSSIKFPFSSSSLSSTSFSNHYSQPPSPTSFLSSSSEKQLSSSTPLTLMDPSTPKSPSHFNATPTPFSSSQPSLPLSTEPQKIVSSDVTYKKTIFISTPPVTLSSSSSFPSTSSSSSSPPNEEVSSSVITNIPLPSSPLFHTPSTISFPPLDSSTESNLIVSCDPHPPPSLPLPPSSSPPMASSPTAILDPPSMLSQDPKGTAATATDSSTTSSSFTNTVPSTPVSQSLQSSTSATTPIMDPLKNESTNELAPSSSSSAASFSMTPTAVTSFTTTSTTTMTTPATMTHVATSTTNLSPSLPSSQSMSTMTTSLTSLPSSSSSSSTTVTCPQCQTVSPVSARFCSWCGLNLTVITKIPTVPIIPLIKGPFHPVLSQSCAPVLGMSLFGTMVVSFPKTGLRYASTPSFNKMMITNHIPGPLRICAQGWTGTLKGSSSSTTTTSLNEACGYNLKDLMINGPLIQWHTTMTTGVNNNRYAPPTSSVSSPVQFQLQREKGIRIATEWIEHQLEQRSGSSTPTTRHPTPTSTPLSTSSSTALGNEFTLELKSPAELEPSVAYVCVLELLLQWISSADTYGTLSLVERQTVVFALLNKQYPTTFQHPLLQALMVGDLNQALQYCLQHQWWGQAFMLASQMDANAWQQVVNPFLSHTFQTSFTNNESSMEVSSIQNGGTSEVELTKEEKLMLNFMFKVLGNPTFFTTHACTSTTTTSSSFTQANPKGDASSSMTSSELESLVYEFVHHERFQASFVIPLIYFLIHFQRDLLFMLGDVLATTMPRCWLPLSTLCSFLSIYLTYPSHHFPPSFLNRLAFLPTSAKFPLDHVFAFHVTECLELALLLCSPSNTFPSIMSCYLPSFPLFKTRWITQLMQAGELELADQYLTSFGGCMQSVYSFDVRSSSSSMISSVHTLACLQQCYSLYLSRQPPTLLNHGPSHIPSMSNGIPSMESETKKRELYYPSASGAPTYSSTPTLPTFVPPTSQSTFTGAPTSVSMPSSRRPSTSTTSHAMNRMPSFSSSSSSSSTSLLNMPTSSSSQQQQQQQQQQQGPIDRNYATSNAPPFAPLPPSVSPTSFSSSNSSSSSSFSYSSSGMYPPIAAPSGSMTSTTDSLTHTSTFPPSISAFPPPPTFQPPPSSSSSSSSSSSFMISPLFPPTSRNPPPPTSSFPTTSTTTSLKGLISPPVSSTPFQRSHVPFSSTTTSSSSSWTPTLMPPPPFMSSSNEPPSSHSFDASFMPPGLVHDLTTNSDPSFDTSSSEDVPLVSSVDTLKSGSPKGTPKASYEKRHDPEPLYGYQTEEQQEEETMRQFHEVEQRRHDEANQKRREEEQNKMDEYETFGPSKRHSTTKHKKKSYYDDEDEELEDDFLRNKKNLKKNKNDSDDEDDEDATPRSSIDSSSSSSPGVFSIVRQLFGRRSTSSSSSSSGGSIGSDESSVKPIKANLGEANSFYYDETLKRWVNKKQSASSSTSPSLTATSAPTPPPPPLAPPPLLASTPGFAPPPFPSSSSTSNNMTPPITPTPFTTTTTTTSSTTSSIKSLRGRSKYVNILNPNANASSTSTSSSSSSSSSNPNPTLSFLPTTPSFATDL